MSLLIFLALWAAWQLTRLAVNTRRTADALEALGKLAERGRR